MTGPDPERQGTELKLVGNCSRRQYCSAAEANDLM
jgi:hypothetical protein